MPAGLNDRAGETNDVTIANDVGTNTNGVRGIAQRAGGTATAGNANNVQAAAADKNKNKGGKKGETLFGPDLGLEEGEAEGWLGNGQNQIRGAAGGEAKEKVPLSVVKEWVDRAKKEDVSVWRYARPGWRLIQCVAVRSKVSIRLQLSKRW